LAATAWEDFSNYEGQAKPIIWTTDIQDLGEVKYFTLDIQTAVSGRVEYYDIFVSDTGLFIGEETVYRCIEGDFNVPSFFGRFYAVQVKVSGTDLFDIQMTASSEIKTVRLNNVNTATLSGTSSARSLSLNYPVSGILDIDIRVKTPTSYIPNLYVSDTATSVVLIPMIVSKDSTTPQIALYGIDNEPRDGLVDIVISALPRQVMFGGNLTVIF
jgi:hypothetical protein